ncbi:hypothetical protein FNF29_07978 [Cafeteria roenbergensis]|uniref:Multidrug and toxin extrusion protein n=1 Tax=Cafeteria roenbergensis TaxID=33653 RepID=A0A5A8C405_CAFRO|nr:hypothetical protein FNF29_07978 [Cafeteria roenbergensis]|eukprot:KAA0146571.1 hypothetical protein FNF29_07978 [Cafeteria roenbergensis]
MAADLSKALLDEAEAGPDAVVVGGRTLNGGKPARLSDASGSDADSDAGSDKEPKTCCGFAGSFADETNRMVALAWPVAIGYLSTSAMTTVDMGFVGHLGKDELAAMSVSNVVMMGTFAVSVGIMGSLGPLCSQAFGAQQYNRVATWLQVSVVWPTLLFFPPMVLIWCFAGEIMTTLGVQSTPRVTELADQFGRFSLLWLWPAMLFNALSMWLESMEIVWPITIISIFFIGVNFLLNWILVAGMDGAIDGWEGMGFLGSPVATAVSKVLQIIALWAWVFPICKYHRKHNVWRPWSTDVLDMRLVSTFLRMGIPMALTEAVFDWSFEILTGFSGGLSVDDVAVMGVLVNMLFLFQPLQMGVYTAVSIRVGNKLGDGDADAARRVARVGTLWGTVCAIGVGGLLWALSPVVGQLFTSEPEILHLTAATTPLLAIDMTLSSLSFTAQGILEGQGRPELATYAALGGNWLVGLPLAWALAVPAGFGLAGLWWGTIAGEVVHSVVLLVMASRTNWELEVTRAAELAEKEAAEEEAIERALGDAGGASPPSDDGSVASGAVDDNGDVSGRRRAVSAASIELGPTPSPSQPRRSGFQRDTPRNSTSDDVAMLLARYGSGSDLETDL